MKLQRFQQISESHCGPAVIQMLLDAVDISASQQEISLASGVGDISEGTRVDQLALATTTIAPGHSFWYKFHSTIDDVIMILKGGYAVGVEWQGLFYNTLEEQEANDDGEAGHYSIISFLDEELGQLIMVDPYKDFANQNRILPIKTFVQRWWDTNRIADPVTGNTRQIVDEQLLFFITPSDKYFPMDEGFKRYHSVT